MDSHITSPQDLPIVARQILTSLSAQSGATVLALSGDLGAGKTSLMQAIGRELGITEEVSSPTFIVARYYDLVSHPHFDSVVHVDAYRIADSSELAVLKWDALMLQPRTLVVVEWPEMITQKLPPHTRTIKIFTTGETARRFRDTTIGA
jgi:tRNA threonylcarbamoyladenosine biosynthesis protein TsaE